MFVKVCGLKTAAQIDDAVALGYDAVGFVMHAPSRRYVDEGLAEELISHAKGRATTFVVGVSFDEVRRVAHLADYVQVSEAVSLPNLAYASHERPPLPCKLFIYDASRGSGVYSGFPGWLEGYGGRLVISGGLTPSNVADAIRQVKPFGVDVSSGVEKDGIKNYTLMKQFIHAAKGANIYGSGQ